MSRRRRQKGTRSEDGLPKMARCPACDRSPCWSCELEDGVLTCRVGCPSCGARTGERGSLEEAIAIWNEGVRLLVEDMSTLKELREEGVKLGGINIQEVSEVTKMLEKKQMDWRKCRDVGVVQNTVVFSMDEFQSVLEVMKKARRIF